MSNKLSQNEEQPEDELSQKRFSFGPISEQQLAEESEFIKPKKVCIRQSPEKLNYKVRKTCHGDILNIYDYYQPQKLMGQGAFGIVYQTLNSKTNQLVAIKKIKNTFLDLNDTKRIYREIKLLKFLNHKNIIKLIDIIKPESRIDYNDYYLVFEYMQTDLEKVIKSKQILKDEHLKLFLFQLLNGVYYMHSADLIHRDLKPNNLLLNKDCELKVADLGLARKYEDISSQTDYVVTRWYRAPEVMLSCSQYTKAIDIWSCGCILAELLGRYPIFRGQHFLDQIERIIAIMGTPKSEDLPFKIDDNTMQYLKQLPQRDPIKFEEIYPNASPLALDLLNKMLVYNPKQRWTAEQCIKHPYFENLFKKQPELQKCTDSFQWDFDKIELQRHKLQEALFEESLSFFDEKNFL